MVPLPTVDALDAIIVPVTCPVPWDTMTGDDRTRFCGRCGQNVHDVSELTRAEAVRLVTTGGPLPCLRLYRRQDGRVMTADCAGRRERAWRWLHRHSPWAAAVFGLVFFVGCGSRPVECAAGKPVRLTSSDAAVQSVVGVAAVEAAKRRDAAPNR